ncbi:interleukin-17C-like isoform X2 [Sparus aurata]|uniref:Interleukin-17C-like n=1 Tax=Sparus aurata TaxID=8175 RepID=A0A671TRB9_SPAAU|nr:interleukin-17C-like isoform X2 [Sparus aurata]
MTWASLQTVFLGSLLVFNDFSSPRCISKQELKDLADRSQTKYWNKWNVSVRLPDSRSCMQAAQEMRGAGNNRCVSPWRYRVEQEDDRIPRDIAFAECICKGCIIDGQQNQSYNSKLVFAWMKILKKTTGKCQDSIKYMVKKEFIKVPVGCTCVVPNYMK